MHLVCGITSLIGTIKLFTLYLLDFICRSFRVTEHAVSFVVNTTSAISQRENTIVVLGHIVGYDLAATVPRT